MLTIRNEQLTAFLEEARLRLIDGIVLRLRTRMPGGLSELTDTQLRQRVASAVAKAETLGFKVGEAIYAFTVTMFQIGPDFCEYPPIADKFNRPRMTAEERWRFILSTTAEGQWKGAKARSRAEAWDELSRSCRARS